MSLSSVTFVQACQADAVMLATADGCTRGGRSHGGKSEYKTEGVSADWQCKDGA